MKQAHSFLSALSLILAFSAFLPTQVFAHEQIMHCSYSFNNKFSGDWISNGEVDLRSDQTTTINIKNPGSGLKQLHVAVSCMATSPDNCSTSLEAKNLSAGEFFNAGGSLELGASFGDLLNFGLLKCSQPQDVPFYFLDRGRVITKLDQKLELYPVLTRPGTCVSGDIAKAAAALEKTWTMPIENVRPTAAGILWTEKRTKCLKFEGDGDLPSGGHCLKEKVISLREMQIPACAANE
jgi:hypothetical protein